MARAGVRRKRKNHEPASPLEIGLADPGLTPILRAGLGGLAASVRAHAMKTEQSWPGPVRVGPGIVMVEPRTVRIEWGDAAPIETLKALFEASFRVNPAGIIDLPGTYDPISPPSLELAASLQDGLKRTFLQHGRTTKKRGGRMTATFELDGVPATFAFQPYDSFAHQNAFKDVEAARTKGSVTLAGWANPGAVARHIAVKATELRYDAGTALCACFAIVGCLSYQVPRTSGGALIIPEPDHLVRFARTRPRLTPRDVRNAYVAGTSDGILAVHLTLRMEDIAHNEGGIAAVSGVQLKAMPWASPQKTRYGVVSPGVFTDHELDLYDECTKTLPSRLRIRKSDGSVFGVASALRGFIAENLASHAPWYRDFATATDGGPEGRRIHYYRERDNLGALFMEEREGLIAMLNHLEAAELALVRAVHVALRRRFGAIADETQGNPATRKNRWTSERDRWRHAFAGSKTPEQIRAALADLWSRAGSNKELQEHWEAVLPLLRPGHWKTARDLALVALASYRGATKEEEDAVNADGLEDE